jgi:hypothetical protein
MVVAVGFVLCLLEVREADAAAVGLALCLPEAWALRYSRWEGEGLAREVLVESPLGRSSGPGVVMWGLGGTKGGLPMRTGERIEMR